MGNRNSALKFLFLGAVLFGLICIVPLCVAPPIILPGPWNNYRVNDETPFIEFRDSNLDFTIRYPMTWYAASLPKGIIVSSPNGPIRDYRGKAMIGPEVPLGPNVLIRLERAAERSKLEELVSARRNEILSEGEILQLSQQRFDLQNVPAVIRVYAKTESFPIIGKGKSSMKELYFLTGGNFYILRFGGRESDYVALEKTFTKMIETIDLNKR